MKPDLVNYRKALNSSLIGLIVQAGIAGLLFVYAYINKDHAAMSASILVGIGLISWVTLIIIFDQHRRERVEAFEHEAYEQSTAAAASVFERGSDDLRVALKRLRGLYRFFLPAMGIVISGLLIAVGLIRLGPARKVADPANFEPASGGMLFALLVTVLAGLGGFITARYFAGMAKQKVWTNLGAGATATISASVVGALVFAGHAAELVGSTSVHRWVTVGIPVLMVALGAEFLLNQILEIYRPRKRDEWARPAFDSKFLSVLAAPDRVASSVGEAISYQLGADISESWFYKIVRRWSLALLLLGITIGWLLTSFAVLRPHEQALILRFGQLVQDEEGNARVLGPGLHVKAPWPIDRVVIPEFVQRNPNGDVIGSVRTATGQRTFQLGSGVPQGAEAILWTTKHGPSEVLSIVRAGSQVDGSESDLALAAVEAPVQYVIGDVEQFERLAAPEMRDRILQAVGQRELTRFLAGKTLDDVLGPGRDELAKQLLPRIENAFADVTRGAEGIDAIPSGVRIVHVGAHGTHPPLQAAVGYENFVEQTARNVARETDAQATAVQIRSEAAGTSENAQAIIQLLDERYDPLVDERLRLTIELNQATGQRREELLRDLSEVDESLQSDGLSDEQTADLQLARQVLITEIEPASGERKIEIEARIAEIDLERDTVLLPELRDLLSSGGEAGRLLAQARADRVATVVRARVAVLESEGRDEAYRANTPVYRATLYFEMLSELFNNKRLYIVDGDVEDLIVQLELLDAEDVNVTFGVGEEGQ